MWLVDMFEAFMMWRLVREREELGVTTESLQVTVDKKTVYSLIVRWVVSTGGGRTLFWNSIEE